MSFKTREIALFPRTPLQCAMILRRNNAQPVCIPKLPILSNTFPSCLNMDLRSWLHDGKLKTLLYRRTVILHII